LNTVKKNSSRLQLPSWPHGIEMNLKLPIFLTKMDVFMSIQNKITHTLISIFRRCNIDLLENECKHAVQELVCVKVTCPFLINTYCSQLVSPIQPIVSFPKSWCINSIQSSSILWFMKLSHGKWEKWHFWDPK